MSKERFVNAYIKRTRKEIETECTKCPKWEGFCTVKECIKPSSASEESAMRRQQNIDDQYIGDIVTGKYDKSQPEQDTWLCTKCSKENEPHKIDCERCGYPKSGTIHPDSRKVIESEPTLRGQFGRLLCKIDNAGCLKMNACNYLNCPLTKETLDNLESVVEAHDQQVASNAVSEFTEECKRKFKLMEASPDEFGTQNKVTEKSYNAGIRACIKTMEK